jgi:hypothetical protein
MQDSGTKPHGKRHRAAGNAVQMSRMGDKKEKDIVMEQLRVGRDST